jgi:hypothetical protein
MTNQNVDPRGGITNQKGDAVALDDKSEIEPGS